MSRRPQTGKDQVKFRQCRKCECFILDDDTGECAKSLKAKTKPPLKPTKVDCWYTDSDSGTISLESSNEKPIGECLCKDKKSPKPDTCIKIKETCTPEKCDAVTATSRCNDTITIFVKADCGDSCANIRDLPTEESDLTQNTSTKSSKSSKSNKSDKAGVPLKAPFVHFDNKTTNTDPRKADDDDKNFCFRFFKWFRKKDVKSSKSNNTQTFRAGQNNVDTQSSEINIAEIVRTCMENGKGNCNTNTIIFPRDKSGGDNLTNLEKILRDESKTNSKRLEDVLNELKNQKKDIQNLKYSFDKLVNMLQDTNVLSPPAKRGFFGRKKLKFENTSSAPAFKSCDCDEVKSNIVNLNAESSEGKKKKSKFPWCK